MVMSLANNLVSSVLDVKATDGVYTKPEMYEKNYHGVMKEFKMVDGRECIEDSQGKWTPVLFTASVGEMPSICGSASDSAEVRKEAERESLKEELERLGYDDVSTDEHSNYDWCNARREIYNQAKANVKHIGDMAVKKWTDSNIQSYIAGDRTIDIEPQPMKTQEDLDNES